VSEEQARRFLSSLAFSWNPATEVDVNLEYFLNSVEEIDYDGERLLFSGICSTIIRG
jgi:hypothetical protein